MERRAYGQMSMEAWRNLVRTGMGQGQRYDPQRILPDGGPWREEMVQAEKDGPGATMAIPLKVREQVIGVLDAYKPSGTGEWTDDEVALFQALVDQLGVALDSARLYQDAQRRATQDRVLGEVAGRMRETLDMDAVIKTAVRDIGEALGIAEVEVRMGTGSDRVPATKPGRSGDDGDGEGGFGSPS